MGRAKHIAGQTFGRLTAISINAARSKRLVFWNCTCSCGNTHVASGKDLISGNTKSCGCLMRDKQHGMVSSPEYQSWVSMKTRCLNSKHEAFHRYGGRGITICDRWLQSFTAFFADMGPRPTGTTLERKDNNGNYEPDNCYWGTLKQQANNRSCSRPIEFDGDKKTLVEWAEFTGIRYTTLKERIRHGWSVERALTAAVQSKSANTKTVSRT